MLSHIQATERDSRAPTLRAAVQTYELFITGLFRLLLPGHGWPRVTGTPDTGQL